MTKKEEILRRIDEGKITLKEIKAEGYDFEVILKMFNFFMEEEAMQLAFPCEQIYILSSMGCNNSKLYRKLAPHIKPEVWSNNDIAYMILSRCVPEFRNVLEYVPEFKKYVQFIDTAEVSKLALHKLYAGRNEEKDDAYFVLYLILDSLSKTGS